MTAPDDGTTGGGQPDPRLALYRITAEQLRRLERFIITATSPERTFDGQAFRISSGLAVHPGPGPGSVDLDTPRGPLWASPRHMAGPLRPASHAWDHRIDRWLPLTRDQQPDLDQALAGAHPPPRHHEAWEVAWSVAEQAWVSWSDTRPGWVRWDAETGRWEPADHELD